MFNWKFITMAAVSGAGLWTWISSEPRGATYLDWSVPRTIRATNGRVYENVTIRSLTPDGGVIVNHNGSSVKFPSGSFDKATMDQIVHGGRNGNPANARIGGNTLLDQRPTRVYYRPNVTNDPNSTNSRGSANPSSPSVPVR